MNIYRLTCWLGAIGIIFNAPVAAQIAPDGSIPTSVISADGLNFTIDNGAVFGNNLFHSFREFSIPTNGSVFFNNGANIQNIFSRIIGENISQIDGLIRANGSANLFLLNPAGIIFGPNARLNIGGSFIGTTAIGIRFADGIEFSATNPSTSQLLSISVPIGLQVGPNPAGITVQGTGHSLALPIPVFSPFIQTKPSSGMGVNPGNTFALVGGDITLAGGVIAAPEGRIELGSVAGGSIELSPIDRGWAIDYGSNLQYRDINLAQKALADTSGNGSGSIRVQARNLSLRDGSLILSQNQGPQLAGSLTIDTTDSINLIGTSADGQIYSGLFTENLGSGSGGKITVSTQQLLLQNGGSITATGFGTGSGGNIEVNSPTSVQLVGLSSPGTLNSRINALTFNSGKAGDVQLSTGQLLLRNGGTINSITFRSGLGGKVNINVTDVIDIAGANPITFSNSVISAATFGEGKANNLVVNTQRLVVRDGARITTSTFAAGDAGNLFINAIDSVEVSGRFPGLINPSVIDSSANILNEVTRNLFRLPPQPTGKSGNITINTQRLVVRDEGLISVNNQGSGDSGVLQLNANNIFLDNKGTLAASTVSGQGGNILIQADNLLFRHDSQITATALGGTKNGGNITINVPILTGLENSDIIANAFQGNGGNIQINTQGIFGLGNRPELTPESDITASSQLGIGGTISISNLNLQPETLVFFPINTFVDRAPVIASSCLTQRNTQQGRFVVTGNGGLSETPDNLAMPYEVTQVIPVGRLGTTRNRAPETANSTPTDRSIQEATGWAFTPDGKLTLVINQTQPSQVDDLTCSF